jgi:crossover junction endodeoxyribonuclease RusA
MTIEQRIALWKATGMDISEKPHPAPLAGADLERATANEAVALGRRAYTFTLPYPPTVGNYWRRTEGTRLAINKAGLVFRANVRAAVFASLKSFPEPTKMRLAVKVLAFPPDRRKRDLDNVLKALLDALQKCGIYADDSQIDDLRIVRREVVEGGKVIVTVDTLEDAE